MNVMIFSVSIGHGHNQVARAVSEELKASGHTVQVIDALEFVNPFFSKVLLESYLKMLRFTPSIYGRLYQWTEEPAFFDFASIINNLLSSGFKKLLAQFKPDALVCTHSFPAGLLSALKIKLDIDIPLIATVTDFTVHYSYVNQAVNTYVVASPKLCHNLRHLGVQEHSIAPLGIPIRPRFLKPPSKTRARRQLDLNQVPTVLLMGGGLGMGTSAELVRVLDHYLNGCQMVVIAGTNESLYKDLRTSRFVNPVEVLGYVENVETYMAAADVLVTKPGGVTCAEALAMALPMAFISPIPGQEWRNSAFLVEQLVAIQFEVSSMAPKLADLVRDELRLSCMSRIARQLSKPNATKELVAMLEQIALK